MSEQPKTCPYLFYRLTISACKKGHWCNHYGDYHKCALFINAHPNFITPKSCDNCHQSRWNIEEQHFACERHPSVIFDNDNIEMTRKVCDHWEE